MHRRTSWLLALLLAGCQPALPATPLPTPAVWEVQFTPALSWMGASLNACTLEQQGIAIIVHERPASALDPQNASFTLQWGPPAQVPGSASILAEDELVFIVHPDNPLDSLSLENAAKIYGGSIRSWEKVSPEGTTPGTKIAAWEYPSGDDVQNVFMTLLSRQGEPRPFVLFAPDPAAMRQAVSEDPAAIGYLPRRWLDASVQELALTGVSRSQLRQPIVVLTPSEPEGAQRAWLLCLQENLNQDQALIPVD